MKYFEIIDKNIAAIFQLQWKIGKIFLTCFCNILCYVGSYKPYATPRYTMCSIRSSEQHTRYVRIERKSNVVAEIVCRLVTSSGARSLGA